MRRRGQHLQEERLYDCYWAVRGGESLDPPVAEHLADCDECGLRYTDLSQFLDTVRADAAAETDTVFTSERLRAQRQVIVRRIEHLGHPARVITFPGRPAVSHGAASPRPARRWIAAAAAAGLFVGVGTGLFFDWETGRGARRRPSTSLARQTNLAAPAGRIELVRPGPSQSDEAFLSELELAGDRPRIRELIAVDALTPHVREINLR